MPLNLSANMADYPFHARLPVRIGDLIGGLHVANSTLVSYLNEVQMQFFAALGFPSLTVNGLMPMNRQMEIIFLSESRYGDVLNVGVQLESFDERTYVLAYKIDNEASGRSVSEARMHMIFFDLAQKKRSNVPAAFISAYQQLLEKTA